MDNTIRVIKRAIANEWCSALPHLKKFREFRLYKIVGPTVLGIELINIPGIGHYRPHFMLYPLWKKDIRNCLSYPPIQIYLRKKNGLQFDIRYDEHRMALAEAVDCVQQQFAIPFNRDVTLNEMFELVDTQMKTNLIQVHSAKQGNLMELKLLLALYTGSDETKNIISQIENASKDWDIRLFESWWGNYDLWLNTIKATVNQRDEFLTQIEINRKESELRKLSYSELISQ